MKESGWTNCEQSIKFRFSKIIQVRVSRQAGEEARLEGRNNE